MFPERKGHSKQVSTVHIKGYIMAQWSLDGRGVEKMEM